MKQKVVLAYSGGLDTSVILRWIRETYDAEIVTYTGDVGQGAEEIEAAREAAARTGAHEILVEDLKKEFATECIFPALPVRSVPSALWRANEQT